jgi:hypothetical protein
VGRGKTKGEDWFDRDRDVNVKNYIGLGSYIILFFIYYVDIIYMILNLNICIIYFKMYTIST